MIPGLVEKIFGEIKRQAFPRDDGGWRVVVTPPESLGLPSRAVSLTGDQYDRYIRWCLGEGLIQEMLPDVSPQEREILLNGTS